MRRWFSTSPRGVKTFTFSREMTPEEIEETSRHMDEAFARMDEAFAEMDAAFKKVRG